MRIRILVVCVLLASFILPLAQAESGDSNGMAYEEKGNIFLKVEDKITQLTNTGRDSEPVQSPDGRWVAFSREIEGKVKECEGQKIWACPRDQLWIVDLQTRTEQMLLEPREEDKDVKKVIYYFRSKTFSPDSQTIYFVTPAYAVSDAIHAFDIDGKNERYITHGNSLQVVREPLSPDIKKYIAESLKEDDWRIFPKKAGASLIEKALKDDVKGYLIIHGNGVRIISSSIPLEGGWEGSDGKYYKSTGRRSWTKLVSPDGSIGIPIGEEEW